MRDAPMIILYVTLQWLFKKLRYVQFRYAPLSLLPQARARADILKMAS